MISNILVPFFQKLFSKYGKHGFTLAEALIITVMTGACLLPILGTMQNAQVRTENYDHYSKMQMFARSRLNAEIANAAFDHKSINTENEYHYIVYFASSTTTESADANEAKLIELPKSYVTIEDLASLTTDPEHANWATSAIDLLGINRNLGAPYLKIVHAYKTSVETQYNFKMADFTSGDVPEVPFASPKGLLGIVVKTCLLYSNEQYYHEKDGYLKIDPPITEGGNVIDKDTSVQVVPVTLFSLANLPTVSDEFIWMVDKHRNKVIGIDPVSRSKSTEITFDAGPENEPLHIAVHPSGKILAVQCKKKIYLVNIDLKSPYKENKKEILSQAEDFADKEHGGIAFRTDGKVLYYTNKTYKPSEETEVNPSLIICGFDFKITDNILEWGDDNSVRPTIVSQPQATINFKNYGSIFSNIVAANDGYLYIGGCEYKNNAGGEAVTPPAAPAAEEVKVIYKYPMYVPFSDGQECGTIQIVKSESAIKNIDVSFNGKYLLCIPKTTPEETKPVVIYDSNSGKEIKSISTSLEITHGIFIVYSDSNVSVSDSSLFVALSGKKGTPKKASVEIYALNDKNWSGLENSDLVDSGNIISSPADGKLVFNSKYDKEGTRKNRLFFSNFLYNTNHELTEDEAMDLEERTGGPAGGPAGTGGPAGLEVKSEFAINIRDVMGVAYDNIVKLYNINTLKQIEDAEFTASNNLKGIAMNPTGDLLLGYYGTQRGGYTKFYLNSLDNSDNTVPAQSSKYVFDDSVPNIGFSLEDRNDLSSRDAFWELDQDGSHWETPENSAYDRRDYDIDIDWKRIDMIGMPKGGALVLYGKGDGSSMIEWIGRRNWGHTNIGKYRLFARWVSNQSVTKIPKEIPSFTNDEFDSTAGGLIVEVSQSFPYGSVVNKMNYTKPSGGGGKITPLILQKVSYSKFKIIDIVESTIDMPSSSETNTTIDLTWKNGGKIIENCYMGFWFGDLEDASGEGQKTGCIPYSVVTTDDGSDYTFYCDSTINDIWPTKNEIMIGAEVCLANNSLKDTIADDGRHLYRRKYKIQFEADVNEHVFPPFYSKKLAISPDCGTLAILSGIDSTDSKLSMFDFNNHIYGPETQIEGMLVDYREPFDSGERSGEREFNWPEESDDSLFKEVQDMCRFSLDGIASFSFATTKYDSWKSFNNYPFNYYVKDSYVASSDINTKKLLANKRFFGYFRPEYNVARFQTLAEDDIRFFQNKNFLFGRYDTTTDSDTSPSALPSRTETYPLDFFCKANESTLLQIDQASNKNDAFGSIFFASKFKDFDSFKDNVAVANIDGVTGIESKMYSINSGNFKYLNSDETYILKNYPTHMWSCKAETINNKGIGVNNTYLLFSRDKANPLLYVVDSDNNIFWTIGRDRIGNWIDNEVIENDGITSNHVISADGQKLLYAVGNKIKAFDISTPSSTALDDTFNLSNSSEYKFATLPFTSFKTSDNKGSYRTLSCTTSIPDFKIDSNGAAVVASGGIYIHDGNKSFLLYNPVNGESKDFLNVLKKKSDCAAATTYDDTIYIYGSNKGYISNTNNPSDRVQAFDTKTENAYSSLDIGDSLSFDTTNIVVSLKGYDDGFSNAIGLVNNNSNWVNDLRYLFTSYEWLGGFGSNSLNKPSISYKIKNNHPVRVNKISFNNNKWWGWYRCVGVKSFKFYGKKNGQSEVELLNESDIQVFSYREFNIDDSKVDSYDEYKFEFVATYDGYNDYVFMDSLTFYRTKVNDLTPAGGWKKINDYKYKRTIKPGKDVIVKSSDRHPDHLFSTSSDHWHAENYSNGYIMFSFPDAIKVSIVKIANKKDYENYITAFKLYGSLTGTDEPSESSYNSGEPDPTVWVQIGDEVTNLTNCEGMLTYELNNTDIYNYYLFKITGCSHDKCCLGRLGLYADSDSAANEDPSSDYLTSLLKDDLKALKVGYNAACSTPYGLVTTGGRYIDSGSFYPTKSSLLYWPHAINRYDGQFYEYGISRSIPEMNNARMQHSMVWHKGKIYVIGGTTQLNTGTSILSGDTFIEYFDYNKEMRWITADTSAITMIGGTKMGECRRFNHGCVSFGDEIFVFSGRDFGEGADAGGKTKTAYAWNPETNVIRKIADLPVSLYPCSAVVYGSKIYVLGMNETEFKIFEYTP